jgi:hypothetical protein
MASLRPSFLFSRLAVFCLCAALAVSGCSGGSAKLVPVKGKITLDGSPLKAGAVAFLPDAAKGNKSTAGGSGTIKEDGEYELFNGGKPGCPLGWYKVTVTANAPMGSPGGQVADPTKGGGGVAPLGGGQSAQINAKFGDATTTDLSVEVVASPAPGAYDLKVTK